MRQRKKDAAKPEQDSKTALVLVLQTAVATAITTIDMLVYMDLLVNTFTYLKTILVLVYTYLYSFSLRSF